MNLGITDAVALAKALAEVLNDGQADTLDAYSASQRQKAQQVLTLTGRLTKVSTMPRPLRPIRNSAMRLAAHVPAARRQLAWRLSGLVYR
jgi:2-polyprenyl-6-methoxyphenol hydroxylase-like FAD-dependent oxidoreductase